jgi:hypothetical protein
MFEYDKMLLQSWWVGVDPGTCASRPSKMGYAAFLDSEWTEVHYLPCHEIRDCQIALKGLRDVILGICIEEVPAHFGKPHGDSCRWHDRCLWLDLRHSMVAPVKWQKLLGEHKKKGDKKSSIEYVKAVHPGALGDSIHKNTGKADALCLALYAEQHFKRR